MNLMSEHGICELFAKTNTFKLWWFMKLISKFSIINTFKALLKQIYIPLLSLVLFTNCSSTLMLPGESDYQKKLDDINYLGSRHWSKVFLIDSTVFSSSDLIISSDSLIFHDDEADKTMCVKTDKVQRIVFLDRISNLLSSCGIGLGSGLVTTLVGLAIFYDKKDGYSSLNAVIAGVIAIPLGFIAGTMFTGEKEYVFRE